MIDAEQARKILEPPQSETKTELQLFIERFGTLKCLVVRQRPEPGKDVHAGWRFSRLAWKTEPAFVGTAAIGKRALLIALKDGKPQLDTETAQRLLDCANGNEKALAEFAELVRGE